MTDQTQDAMSTMTNSVKQAFAPMTDALKNIDVPEAARDFVKRAASTAKDRVSQIHTGSEKVTSAIETAATDSVGEIAKIARNVQQAMVHDAEAYFSGIEKLASAKSLSEAAQIQTEMVKSAGEVFVARAKSTTEYLSKMIADSAKTAQDNLSKAASYAKSA
jgi:phasin